MNSLADAAPPARSSSSGKQLRRHTLPGLPFLASLTVPISSLTTGATTLGESGAFVRRPQCRRGVENGDSASDRHPRRAHSALPAPHHRSWDAAVGIDIDQLVGWFVLRSANADVPGSIRADQRAGGGEHHRVTGSVLHLDVAAPMSRSTCSQRKSCDFGVGGIASSDVVRIRYPAPV